MASRPVGGPGGTRPRRRAFSRVALAVACSLLLTALATFLSWRMLQERQDARGEQVADQEISRLESGVSAYLALLRATRSFVEAEGPALTGRHFATFVAGLRIPSDYPGLQGIGWSPRVARGPDRFEIRYLEPLDDRNRAALGFDMHTDPVRAVAMDRARDLGAPAMSAGVVLKQEIHDPKSPGFLIYLPVYRGGGVPATRDERRERLLGFIYAPLRAVDFFEGVFRDSPVDVHAVRVLGQPGAPALLYGDDRGAAGAPVVREVTVAGQRWTLSFERLSGGVALLDRIRPALVLLLGLLITALVWALTRAQAAERREAERRAAAMGQQVQFAEMLVGIVSHDLRSPLQVIRLNAQLLAAAGLSDALGRNTQRIQASADASLRLVGDLLDFTRARVGQGIPVARTPGDLAEIVARVVEELRATHPGRDIVLATHGDAQGAWDADRIAQVVTNLVSNALAYGASDAPVRVAVHAEKSQVTLDVANEGPPIDPAVLAVLFEPLRRGPAQPGGPNRNIGLGLYIVQEIARAHGGTVSCHSSAAEGTRFEVRLPREA